jgi:hypothetical protein
LKWLLTGLDKGAQSIRAVNLQPVKADQMMISMRMQISSNAVAITSIELI